MLKNRPLCIFLPKMSTYRRDFDKTKCMSFLIKDEKLLYNEIWKKVSSITKKEFDSNPVYNEKYVKTKVKSYNGKINTNVDNKTKRRLSMYLSISSTDGFSL